MDLFTLSYFSHPKKTNPPIRWTDPTRALQRSYNVVYYCQQYMDGPEDQADGICALFYSQLQASVDPRFLPVITYAEAARAAEGGSHECCNVTCPA